MVKVNLSSAAGNAASSTPLMKDSMLKLGHFESVLQRLERTATDAFKCRDAYSSHLGSIKVRAYETRQTIRDA